MSKKSYEVYHANIDQNMPEETAKALQKMIELAVEQAACKHEVTYDEDGVLWCMDCGKILGRECDYCHGRGFGEESELEHDWINFGNDIVDCPYCNGKGWMEE